MSFASSFSGVRVDTAVQSTVRPGRIAFKCRASQDASTRRQLLGSGLALVAAVVSPVAKADIIEDLKAKSEANKELNDKKRLAASYANFARSRTLNDHTCEFPRNVFGCDIEAVAGDVKYITDDIKLACEGNKAGECAEKPNMLNVGP